MAFTETKCRFCKTEFETQVCLGCKQLVPTNQFRRRKGGRNAGYLMRLCNACDKAKKIAHDKAHPEQVKARRDLFWARRREAAERKLNEWMSKTDLPFKPLSDQQWLEACRYFDGCAICGHEHIETKEFFVPFKEGGRYTSWNVFPLCGKCAKAARFEPNPFRWVDGMASKLGLTDERKEKLIEFFIQQIEKVVDEK